MPTTSNCVGVTTFIKTELIADGVGRAHVPRIGGARNGLTNGQRVDHELKGWIDRGSQGPLKHAGSRHVAAGLARLGIRPLKAQVRVTDADLKLTTLIDAVGEGADNTLWVVEVKTTTLSSANHVKSYGSICKRTPVMRNGVTHTEQATHFLQAAFGAMALRSTYAVHPDIDIRACVVVATADACRTYVCPTGFLHRKLFHRRVSVPLSKTKHQPCRDSRYKPRGRPNRRALGDCLAKWPAPESLEEQSIDAALRRMRLARDTRGQQGRSIWTVCQLVNSKKGRPVGVVALVPKHVHRMAAHHRQAVQDKLTAVARRLLARHSSMQAVARLVVCARSFAVAPCPGPLGRV